MLYRFFKFAVGLFFSRDQNSSPMAIWRHPYHTPLGEVVKLYPKKNRQTRVSLAMCGVGVGMMELLEVLGYGQQINGDILWLKLHLTASTALESTFLVCGSRVSVVCVFPSIAP